MPRFWCGTHRIDPAKVAGEAKSSTVFERARKRARCAVAECPIGSRVAGYSAVRFGQSVIVDYRARDGIEYKMTTELWAGRLPAPGSRMDVTYLPWRPKASDLAPPQSLACDVEVGHGRIPFSSHAGLGALDGGKCAGENGGGPVRGAGDVLRLLRPAPGRMCRPWISPVRATGGHAAVDPPSSGTSPGGAQPETDRVSRLIGFLCEVDRSLCVRWRLPCRRRPGPGGRSGSGAGRSPVPRGPRPILAMVALALLGGPSFLAYVGLRALVAMFWQKVLLARNGVRTTGACSRCTSGRRPPEGR